MASGSVLVPVPERFYLHQTFEVPLMIVTIVGLPWTIERLRNQTWVLYET